MCSKSSENCSIYCQNLVELLAQKCFPKQVSNLIELHNRNLLDVEKFQNKIYAKNNEASSKANNRKNNSPLRLLTPENKIWNRRKSFDDQKMPISLLTAGWDLPK